MTRRNGSWAIRCSIHFTNDSWLKISPAFTLWLLFKQSGQSIISIRMECNVGLYDNGSTLYQAATYHSMAMTSWVNIQPIFSELLQPLSADQDGDSRFYGLFDVINLTSICNNWSRSWYHYNKSMTFSLVKLRWCTELCHQFSKKQSIVHDTEK